MSIMHPSKFTELVKSTLYPVMLEDYASEDAVHPRIFEQVPESFLVNPFGYKTTTLTGMGIPVEREDGEDVTATEFGEGWTTPMKIRLIAQKLFISDRLSEALDDKGLQAQLLQGTQGWGRGFMIKKETLAANIFNKGALTAGHLATFDQSYAGEADPYPTLSYDNLPYFDTAHLSKVGGTSYANHRVTSALSSTTLGTARTLMSDTNAFDERDQRISIRPDTLVVPPALEDTAARVVGSIGLPGTAQNDLNPNRGRFAVETWRYLDDSDGWFLGVRNGGVMYYDEGTPKLRVARDDHKGGFWIFAESRFGVAPKNWRHWTGHNIAAS